MRAGHPDRRDRRGVPDRDHPAAFERRFSGAGPMRVAVEAGMHSLWIGRVLEACGHDVLVANARKLRLIYADGRKSDRVDAENLAWG